MQRELQRQQALMRALSDGAATPPPGLAPKRMARGLQAYTDHAKATANRALAAAFPTVVALLGEDAFATLAKKFWHTLPPQKGDLAQWGDELALFIEGCQPLAPWPYLADCARLDWALHLAERSQDLTPNPQTIHLLAQHDPTHLVLELLPSCQVLSSAYPVFTIWLAHQQLPPLQKQPQENHFDNVRAALAQGRAEHAFVWRQGWRAQAQCINPPTATWVRALLSGLSLEQALTQAGDTFEFQTWLVQSLQQPWLARVRFRQTP